MYKFVIITYWDAGKIGGQYPPLVKLLDKNSKHPDMFVT